MPRTPVVLVTRRLPNAVEERLVATFDARCNATDEIFPSDTLIERSRGADALLVTPTEKLHAATVAALPDGIRAIATFSVGYDHIDLAACKARGIVVTNTPDVVTEATAEIAILLILAAARRASEGERMVRAARWTGWSPTQLLGRQLTGRRLGIVGMGRIGRAVARRAHALDMEIHYYNRHRLPPADEAGAIFHGSIDDLLRVSDVLSLHCPASPDTERMLDARRLSLLPPGAIVVNTARGTLVDDDALIEALRDGTVAAAGLDVYRGEPNLHPGYRELDNVFLLPHLGTATLETREAMGFRAIDNLEAFFAGREPRDRIA